MTSIYLAGKISKNDWRQDILEGWNRPNDTHSQWPTIPTIFDGIDYAGPYFINCDHGCTHGPGMHGRMASPESNMCGQAMPPGSGRSTVFMQCTNAINRADIFFAWLGHDNDQSADDHFTGYGTLVELGYAKALGKVIIVAGPEIPEGIQYHWTGSETAVIDDLWFAWLTADIPIKADNPVEALHSVRDLMFQVHDGNQRRLLESPIETAFFDAYSTIRPAELTGLTVQHPVTAGGRNYRLDFALPAKKIAFEMDGKTYHNTDKSFTNDRRRDLALELEGWTIHRFDGDLIRANPANVVAMAAQLVSRKHANLGSSR